MKVLKCPMCGGNLIPEAGGKYGTCDYCGSISPLPKTTDEYQINLFNRANHLRQANEFDKAIVAYENLLGMDDTDAEAHWGALLSRYGIEYVDDPAGGGKLPTCHRLQTAPILQDVDYKATLRYAPDDYTRSLYEKQAQRIAEIQKQILALSQKESPYDIFICYKQSTSSGARTKDSVIAQDIYKNLTAEGYRTFFAEISLEDRVGEQYEPIIFAALNSSKVMLVIGTSSDNLNAVWVKNEWSRFLSLMKTDRSKLLIPCYRDMSPYDLPDEFSMLQAQDIGKIAFMQDLLRGIGKVFNLEKTSGTSRELPHQSNTNDSISALLKRGNMALEDGDWSKADEFFEQILNQDAEFAPAYLGKFLVQQKRADLDAFVAYFLSVSEKCQTTQKAACPPNSDWIKKAELKYSNSNYLTDTIESLYSFDLCYISETDSRKKQYEEAKLWLHGNKFLSRAYQFASGSVRESMDSALNKLYDALQERITKAESCDRENETEIKAKYLAHLTETDAKVARMYEDAMEAGRKQKRLKRAVLITVVIIILTSNILYILLSHCEIW